jgi:hypothetical protein
MVIHQTRVLPVDTTVTAEDEPSLQRFYLSIRYIMTAVGCLPASCIPHLPKSVRVPLAVAQLLMTIVLLIPPVNALFSILGQEDRQDPTVFIYKILCLEVSFLTPFDALCFSVTANMFNTFTDYYGQLSVVQQCFNKMHIDIPHRFMRFSLVMLATSGVLMSGVMVTLFIYDYIHPVWHLDPLFAPEITNVNYDSLDQFLVRLRQLGHVYMVMYGIHTCIKITYLSSVILVIFLLFRGYNKNLENIVKNNPNKLQKDLLMYRHTHLELCQLVENMNRLFRCLLGCMVLAYSVGTLLILYLVSLGLTKDSELRGIMIFWCIMFIFFDIMTIVSCQVIQDQVSLFNLCFFLLELLVALGPVLLPRS